jgi:hypothetical protein
VPTRDWDAEIDAWTERFRSIPDPPEMFARAIRDGWDPADRATLAAEAEAYSVRHEGWLREITASGWDLVRLDLRDPCGACARYAGAPYSAAGAAPDLPPPPPLPICPACRHTLNLLTPFFMQSLGIHPEDLADDAVPYEPIEG